ncbi:ABC transporter permease [Corynebacterium hansenii]|uniref:ABC transporter permease n=1 Tax=Corynebacterium hansenii TaxID=394964 RepID=A0ABV7ZPW7_9CORY|nr:ABC transporter permease [Corynebacterium hansenii]WJZ01184.1 Carnitine transport permease protein OpuCD [Corynebacterium hansenii]
MIRWSWFADNFAQIVDLTWTHVWLSIPPIIAAVLISVPLGFAASRRKAFRGAIVGGAGLLYAIPSLALFVMLPLVLGTSVLSPLNVQVALAAYGVALMTRTAADAFGSVPPAARDAAKSMGYPAWRRILTVELPLAGPVLLAGARVVSASTVSLVSVGSLVGVHGLGYFFTDGFNRSFPTEILAGVIGTAVVALVFDVVLVALGKVLMPWSRAGAGKPGKTGLFGRRSKAGVAS